MTGLINAATAALIAALRPCLDQAVSIETGHPGDAPRQGLSLNLFLYSVRQISVRSAAPPSRDPTAVPSVTLGLGYLVTLFDGSGDSDQSRAAVEAATQFPLTHPVLPAQGPMEAARLTWQPFESSVAQIWPLLGLPYRLSLGWDLAVTGQLGPAVQIGAGQIGAVKVRPAGTP